MKININCSRVFVKRKSCHQCGFNEAKVKIYVKTLMFAKHIFGISEIFSILIYIKILGGPVFIGPSWKHLKHLENINQQQICVLWLPSFVSTAIIFLKFHSYSPWGKLLMAKKSLFFFFLYLFSATNIFSLNNLWNSWLLLILSHNQ